MTASTRSQRLSERLIETIDQLDAKTLRAVRTYVDERLDNLRPTVREQIRSEANGEIADVEDCGAFTLVRRYPPSQGNSRESSQYLSLYRVKREKQLNGEETLHWSYLGDVSDRPDTECANCGAPMETRRRVCSGCEEGTGHRDEEV